MKSNGITKLGRRIQKRLEEKGWSLTRLDQAMGREPSWASHIIRVRWVSLPVGLKLAKVLDVAPEYLAPEEPERAGRPKRGKQPAHR